MIFRHAFQAQAPLHPVAGFHAQPASLAVLTPPPLTLRIEQAPEQLGEGDRMRFTLHLVFLSIHWLACIEGVTEKGFTDRQLQGPFQSWQHRHLFLPLDDENTLVFDEIRFTLKRHPIWGAVGLGIGLSLPLLFGYRAWKTRRILEKRDP